MIRKGTVCHSGTSCIASRFRPTKPTQAMSAQYVLAQRSPRALTGPGSVPGPAGAGRPASGVIPLAAGPRRPGRRTAGMNVSLLLES